MKSFAKLLIKTPQKEKAEAGDRTPEASPKSTTALVDIVNTCDFSVGQTLPEPESSSQAVLVSVAAARAVTEEPQVDLPVLVSLQPPAGSERPPSDFCCILDTSGSMHAEARIQGASGATESHGLSLLDIAKHGVRTIVNMLSDRDRLSIISFNHEAKVVLELTVMNEAGRKKAEDVLDLLSPSGGTHIWRGLHLGLESLRKDEQKGRFAHVMLLTDGESLERDQIVPNLEQYKGSMNEQLPGTINTFGFGYAIDSRLLVQLANIGDGTYSFIPDAGFVGTVFVNTLSNLFVTFSRETYLNIEAGDGCEVVEVLGDQAVTVHSWGSRVKLGVMQFGQSKDVVLLMKTKGKEYLTVSLQYVGVDGQLHKVEGVDAGSLVCPKDIIPNLFRARFVDAITECVDVMRKARNFAYQPVIRTSSMASTLSSADGTPRRNESEAQLASGKSSPKRKSIMQMFAGGAKSVLSTRPNQSGASPTAEEAAACLREAQDIIASLLQDVSGSKLADHEFVKALIEDIGGQTTEALSSETYYWKWGRHYLPSLMFAHKYQQCNNFKDPGVQLYGGDLFQELRDKADEIFDKLPPPKSSAAGCDVAPVLNMSAYNDRYAGCVAGDCQVTLASGAARRVAELVKGDLVVTPSGPAEVVCLVRTRCPGERATLVRLPGGLRVTPHHPVQVDGAWVFPLDLAEPSAEACEAVFGIVLEGAPSMLVEGVPCVALGHRLAEGAAAHPYFASGRAVADLQGLPGFEAGLVEHPGFLRDAETGLVCGLAAP